MDQDKNPKNRPQGRKPQRPGDMNMKRPPRPKGSRPERPPFERLDGVKANGAPSRPTPPPQGRRPDRPGRGTPVKPTAPGRRGPAPAIARPPKGMQKKKGKISKANRAMMIVLDLLIVALIVSAAYLFIWPKVVAKQQMDRRNEILEHLEKGEYSFVIHKDENKVPGEAPEDFGQTGLDFVFEDGPEGDQVTLSYTGRLVISKIQCDTPLAPRADEYHLRFGCGIYELSAPLNQNGQTAIFGHRFLTKNRDFNRLNEVVKGDTFYIDDVVNKIRYIYRVDEQVIINPKDLWDLVHPPNNIASMYGPEDNTVVLVTCHPAVYGAKNERLLIYAHVESTETLPN